MLDNVADRIAHVFANSPVTKAEAARACKVTPQAVTGWIRTGRISKQQVFTLAQLSGFRAEWIATGQGPQMDDGLEVRNARPVYQGNLVPVISYVTAGDFCEAIDNFAPGDAEMWLPCPSPHGPRTFALVIEGDSMTSPYPTERSYPHGTICFFDPDKPYENGSKVVAKLPSSNKVTFKKLVIDDGQILLMPLNPAYKAIEITEELHVCGVLVGAYTAE